MLNQNSSKDQEKERTNATETSLYHCKHDMDIYLLAYQNVWDEPIRNPSFGLLTICIDMKAVVHKSEPRLSFHLKVVLVVITFIRPSTMGVLEAF